jgi:periplasmic protein TonB
MMAESRALLPSAFAVSLALHALTLLLPNPWTGLPGPAVKSDLAFLTARLEPRVAPHAATEVLKNTLDRESPERRPEKTPARPSEAERKAKMRGSLARAERLPEKQLSEALGRLSETLFYPPEALAKGLEGEVVLLLELGEGGRIAAASVASGSGHAVLDEAALRAARRLGALNPALAGKAILLPVRFRIL